MELKLKTPAQAFNKTYLRQPLAQAQIDIFTTELEKVFSLIDEKQSEDYHKNLISDFLKNVYYKDKNVINVNDKYDLIIRLGNKTNDKVGVILEFKKPADKKDMLTLAKPNVKSLHQLILYYLRETIDNENFEIKNLIITNLYEWYIFDELWFEENIFRNKKLVKAYTEWKVAGHDTKHFYEQIAAPYLENLDAKCVCTYVNLKDYQSFLQPKPFEEENEVASEKPLIDIYKLLSPQHLLKQPFANDANTLNQGFYNELLHIMGLEEKSKKETGSNKIITRKLHTNEGSLIENTIEALKTRKFFGTDESNETEQKYFEAALELCITWINRILFLKLLEAQLITYHKKDKKYGFLNSNKIKDFDELNELFFDVLAIPITKRKSFVTEKFGDLPYLNSSLFEHTELENALFPINNLKNRLELPFFAQTVLLKNKNSSKKNTLHYLFEFLNAYNFASDGTLNIQKDSNKLINAAVLGLIFEKINGYKDGSFFTPSYITMYMCRETLRKVVVDKFNIAYKWKLKDFEALKKKIDYSEEEERLKANEIINSIKICDPAVGSGHFLVSALNELIAIKNELRILSHQNKSWIRGYKIEVVNDELEIIDKNDGKHFCYVLNTNNQPIDYLQELQETIFHEKQILIENCLFGVDINPKSVAICRLRLWIELLKNMYYTTESNFSELETLPNLDINIKSGNSLISRYPLDADLSQVFKTEKYSIQTYKMMVSAYKNTKSGQSKSNFFDFLQEIKTKFKENISINDVLKKKLAELKGKSFLLENEKIVGDLFGKNEGLTEEKRVIKLAEIQKEVQKVEKEISDKENAVLYQNAFEWRFEFPEVLNDNGDFVGFDAILANPPYFNIINNLYSHSPYLQHVSSSTTNIASMFIALGEAISTNSFAYVVPKGICTVNSWQKARAILLEKHNLNLISDVGMAFKDVGLEQIFFISHKDFSPSNEVKVLKNTHFMYAKPQSFFIERDKILTSLKQEYFSIIEKMEKGIALGEIAEMPRGVFIDKHLFQTSPNENMCLLLGGTNISQYLIKDGGKRKPNRYISINEVNINPKQPIFARKRIVYQNICSSIPKIVATIAKNLPTDDTVNNLIITNEGDFSYEYILALLNSPLFAFYLRKVIINEAVLTVHLDKPYVGLFPIIKPDAEVKLALERNVNEIMDRQFAENESDRIRLLNEINEQVYQIYGITEEEQKIIEAS